eukprot:scaffold14345_cov21-Tisochrysis_lutea.AAC.4
MCVKHAQGVTFLQDRSAAFAGTHANTQTPEDWERARAQMQGMSPEQLRQQAAAAQQHMSSQE